MLQYGKQKSRAEQSRAGQEEDDEDEDEDGDYDGRCDAFCDAVRAPFAGAKI